MMVTNRASLKPQAVSEPQHAGRRAVPRVALSPPLLFGMVAATVLALALMYVVQRTYLMTLSYRADALERRLQEVLREQEFLELRIAEAQSLAHVEAVATSRLGMVKPQARQMVVMETAPAGTVPAQAEPAREDRGLLAVAVEWVARHWPRLETAEAGGDRR